MFIFDITLEDSRLTVSATNYLHEVRLNVIDVPSGAIATVKVSIAELPAIIDGMINGDEASEASIKICERTYAKLLDVGSVDVSIFRFFP